MKYLVSKLNRAFESRVRLGIMSVLMVNEKLDFSSLKELTGTTDGNLSSHLASLEREGFVKVVKQFVQRKPRSVYSATVAGKKAFREHLDLLEQLIKGQGS